MNDIEIFKKTDEFFVKIIQLKGENVYNGWRVEYPAPIDLMDIKGVDAIESETFTSFEWSGVLKTIEDLLDP